VTRRAYAEAARDRAYAEADRAYAEAARDRAYAEAARADDAALIAEALAALREYRGDCGQKGRGLADDRDLFARLAARAALTGGGQ
jgi:hypothetical protein